MKQKYKSKNRWGRRKLTQRLKLSRQIGKQRIKAERSPAEKRIEKFLIENQIKFIPEYVFRYCYSQKTNHFLYFDFYLPDHNAVIEFDGQHHSKPIYGEAALKEQKYKDGKKNKFCREKGIKMLRIPYYCGNDIETIICRFFDHHFEIAATTPVKAKG